MQNHNNAQHAFPLECATHGIAIAGALGLGFIYTQTYESDVIKCTTGDVLAAFG